MHVLVIEDSRTQAAELEMLLEEGSHRVTLFGALEPALEWCRGDARQDGVDAVLLDLHLPDAEGLETLRRMRERCPELPVVIMTSLADSEVALAALRQGAQDYLVKGQTDLSLLDRVLRYAIERHRASAERARLTEELRVKNAELEALNEIKNQFVGIAAHDLRSPLGIIVVYLQLLRRNDENLTAEQREMLISIQRSTEFMWQLINDLLDVSAIESGQLQLNRTRTDVVELVERAVDRHRLLGEAKNIGFELDHDEALPPIPVDPSKVEQVLNNLLDNAAKFSPPGAHVEVAVRNPDEEAVRVSIFNPGEGIGEAHLEQLFEPFDTKRRLGTAGEKTTGLGLAISKKIIETHGGRIGVDSEPGQGARFWFTLPVDPPAAD